MGWSDPPSIQQFPLFLSFLSHVSSLEATDTPGESRLVVPAEKKTWHVRVRVSSTISGRRRNTPMHSLKLTVRPWKKSSTYTEIDSTQISWGKEFSLPRLAFKRSWAYSSTKGVKKRGQNGCSDYIAVPSYVDIIINCEIRIPTVDGQTLLTDPEASC